jgi:hypothetical protein
MKKIIVGLLAIAGVATFYFGYTKDPSINPIAPELKMEAAPTTQTNNVTPTPVISESNGEPKREEGPKLSPELGTLLEKVSKNLPEIKNLNIKSDEDAHQAPPELMEAGKSLGELAEYLERRPEEFVSASVFYADCASNRALLPAVRAVCYHSLTEKKEAWAPGVKDKLAQVTPDIIEIANDL